MRRLGIVAGDRALPLQIERWARESGVPFSVARVGPGGFALADIAKVIGLFRRGGVDKVVIAGGVRGARVGFSWALVRFAARLLFMKNKVDGVLRLVIAEFEGAGFAVVGVQDLMPELLAGKGFLTRWRPSPAQMRGIKRALPLARKFAATDRGQSSIAVGGRVVAVEGPGGTDALIRGGRYPGGVLLKVAKPHQDMRADAPTIGPETIENAARAGLAGVALDARRAIVESREKTLAAAEKLGIFIVGI